MLQEIMTLFNLQSPFRYHSIYVPSQWEMALQCNAISDWLRIRRMIPAIKHLKMAINQYKIPPVHVLQTTRGAVERDIRQIIKIAYTSMRLYLWNIGKFHSSILLNFEMDHAGEWTDAWGCYLNVFQKPVTISSERARIVLVYYCFSIMFWYIRK